MVQETPLVPADDCVSDDSDFYGSPPTTPTDPAAYLTYHDRLPTVIANKAAPVSIDKTLYNRFEGKPAQGKQLTESVADFVDRLRPSTTYTSTDQPLEDAASERNAFIWADNPFLPLDAHRYGDSFAFRQEGKTALQQFLNYNDSIALELNRNGKNNTLERRLKEPREELEAQLKTLARKHVVKSGKWMIFARPDAIDMAWKLVVEGTVNGRLGIGAKVAKRQRAVEGEGKKREEQVICVYSRDFEDEEDVRRVLLGLRDLGLVSGADNRGIYYKCDAWSLLQIGSGNEYGLRASVYGSWAMLKPPKKSRK